MDKTPTWDATLAEVWPISTEFTAVLGLVVMFALGLIVGQWL